MNREFFRHPLDHPEYASGCFWFWNDKIEKEEMIRQQKLMVENGLKMPMIHSRFGREIEYMGKEWLELVRESLLYGKKLGQYVWLYDEDNWPSGTCSKSVTKKVGFREHFLCFEEVHPENWKKFIESVENKQILEIWEAGKKIPLWLAEGSGKQFPQTVRVKVQVVYWKVRAYEEGGRSCVDYMNPDAIHLFLEKTHETYKNELGSEVFSLVKGFFMDETRFCYCYPWTERFSEEFQKRKGYSILGNLKNLFGTGERTLEELDYLDVAAQLYKEATFWQVYHWCEENHVLSAAHLLGEETLATQSRFEIDLMRQYEAMHVPGLDHLGKGIGSLDARFVVSAARNYGKERICCEAFGASGEDTDMEDVIRVTNWLIQQGVNMIIAHGYYYSTRGDRKNDFPPSYFFQWKDWDKMKAYNEMAARMMELNSGGRFFGNILVYYPIETFWKHYRPDPLEKTGFGENGSKVDSERAAEIDRDYQLFCNYLEDLNVPYQIINNDSMKNYEIVGNKWRNKQSGEQFHTFVLLDAEYLPEKTRSLLTVFCENKGRIFSCKSNVEIKAENFRDLKSMAHACLKITDMGIEILDGPDRCQRNMPAYPAHLIDPFIHNGENIYGIGITRYDKGRYRIYNFTNYNLREETVAVLLNGVENAELWNPEDGDQIPLKGKTVKFCIPANRTRYLVGKEII